MAYLHIKNVVIRGVAACVPSNVEENQTITNIPQQDVAKLIKTTGVERRHTIQNGTCTSDLCLKAAEQLIQELGWDKSEIEGLIFVSQTPDFILPATSAILQDRLGLSTDCFTLDVSLGCSGYVYGLSTIASYMQSGMIRKALLLAGDTSSMTCSVEDKSTYPLFGDAGTATALEYSEGDDGFKFHLGSDGSGYEAIIIKDGGYRNRFKADSLDVLPITEGINRSNLQLTLDGMDVFSFGISKAPESVNSLISKFNIDKDRVDYFYFHQANLMMNDRIRKKLQLPENKVPLSLKNFGNTSSASIPLTMVTETAQALRLGERQIIGCGFGVGLSWASVICSVKNLTIRISFMFNPFTLKDKNVLVTGASSGIGKQIALSSALMGASVTITGRDQQRLDETLKALCDGDHHQHIADLNIEQEIDDLANSLPNLDGVVLSAGIVTTLPFKFINSTELDAIMNTNFFAPILLLNSLLRKKKLNKKSSVVFISSIAGNFIGARGNSMYSASKGAINAMQKVIALELAPQKIRVNNVSPGMVKTNMINNSAFSDEQIEKDEKSYPLGYGEVTDVANAVIYLLSDASKWVTGTSLLVDGGFTIH